MAKLSGALSVASAGNDLASPGLLIGGGVSWICRPEVTFESVAQFAIICSMLLAQAAPAVWPSQQWWPVAALATICELAGSIRLTYWIATA